MTTGLLYDVHGNLAALEAVLADAAGIDAWVLGGDYASFGPRPAEVVARLEALEGAVWIRGNWDRWQGGDTADLPDDADLREGLAAVREALGEATAARLAALPATHRAGDTLFCHACPANDMDSFLPQPGEHDRELLAGTDARRVVFGHTHLAFARELDGVALVNPGSVGMPFDGDPRAAWAVLHDDGRVEHRRVAYDLDATAADLPQRFGERPWVRGTIARMRKASFFV
jgi:predicted phosphodiesterase